MNRNMVRKATGSYRIYSTLVKLQTWFLSLRWKTCLCAKLQPSRRVCVCSERTCPWAEHSDDDDDDDDDDDKDDEVERKDDVVRISEYSAQGQVIHCKVRNQGGNFAGDG